MALTGDILATYRGPGKVVKRLLARGRSEPFALSLAMAGCVVAFIAQWPRISREAYLAGNNAEGYLPYYSAFIALIFIMPIVLYLLAAVSHFVAGLMGGRGSGYGARMAVFWAFLAASPVFLLHGMVAGFIGPGPQLSAVGLIWLLVFVWFWIAGLRQAEWGME
ncbi:MAG TPA: YIP1 family protein [Rhodobacteraceae bacterium]|nr:YIP1 family protein [Paracoccaceae bacterium]